MNLTKKNITIIVVAILLLAAVLFAFSSKKETQPGASAVVSDEPTPAQDEATATDGEKGPLINGMTPQEFLQRHRMGKDRK